MIKPRLFLCSGVKIADGDPRREGRIVVDLDALGEDANVHISLEDVAKVFLQHLKPRLIDLLEIASYVYAADCGTNRGEGWSEDHSIEPWGRDFQFVIPVRDITFWNQPEVLGALRRALNFLSNDIYSFNFEPLQIQRRAQEYLDWGTLDDWPFYGVDRVLMFSGGLDSLAGAVVTANKGDKLLLVSHRPVGKIGKRQKKLFEMLTKRYTNPMHRVHVKINKSDLDRETSQRTRSFLFSALGGVVAESVKANGVSFFENGVVSLNLPLADEVLRSRASRTTHPMSLFYLQKLLRLVTERTDFTIDNPFIFKTKTEIVSSIVDGGAADLIAYTCSCAHTGRYQSGTQLHCGTCSQCIDRRIAVIAAGQADNDLEENYVKDVFTGVRDDGYEHNIAVDYARHVYELFNLTDDDIGYRFNRELDKAASPFPNRRDTVEELIDTHRRHAVTAWNTIEGQVATNVGRLINNQLPDKCMLGFVAERKHSVASWVGFADRITNILNEAIPVACKTEKPKTEPRLQEICDGILRGHELELKREYPFLSWSCVSTKPDWSNELISLWVELKYVRKRDDILKISEDISSDITKYGDNGKKVLFLIYDPYHLIINEAEFSEPIIKRPTMTVSFIR
jgi:7-cyano-7-deazaguanine synthase in queuosine biosynthesis